MSERREPFSRKDVYVVERTTGAFVAKCSWVSGWSNKLKKKVSGIAKITLTEDAKKRSNIFLDERRGGRRGFCIKIPNIDLLYKWASKEPVLQVGLQGKDLPLYQIKTESYEMLTIAEYEKVMGFRVLLDTVAEDRATDEAKMEAFRKLGIYLRQIAKEFEASICEKLSLHLDSDLAKLIRDRLISSSIPEAVKFDTIVEMIKSAPPDQTAMNGSVVDYLNQCGQVAMGRLAGLMMHYNYFTPRREEVVRRLIIDRASEETARAVSWSICRDHEAMEAQYLRETELVDEMRALTGGGHPTICGSIVRDDLISKQKMRNVNEKKYTVMTVAKDEETNVLWVTIGNNHATAAEKMDAFGKLGTYLCSIGKQLEANVCKVLSRNWIPDLVKSIYSKMTGSLTKDVLEAAMNVSAGSSDEVVFLSDKELKAVMDAIPNPQQAASTENRNDGNTISNGSIPEIPALLIGNNHGLPNAKASKPDSPGKCRKFAGSV
jgi:hypothetical protein